MPSIVPESELIARQRNYGSEGIIGSLKSSNPFIFFDMGPCKKGRIPVSVPSTRMTTLMERLMGGNGSYSSTLKGVPETSRTHSEARTRIDGHKILVQKGSETQNKIPMNSNSDNPTYLCARVDKDGNVQITSIAIYENHKLVKSIDLVFDKDGNVIPYSPNKKSSHCHNWDETSSGDVGRKRHDGNNTYPIPREYKLLINKIVKYNKEKHKWNKEKSQ